MDLDVEAGTGRRRAEFDDVTSGTAGRLDVSLDCVVVRDVVGHAFSRSTWARRSRILGPAPLRFDAVDVRIGVTQAPRELNVEVPDDERDDVRAKVDAALSGASDVLWIKDKRGRDVGVPSAKIAYVEIGTADGDRRIGFGG